MAWTLNRWVGFGTGDLEEVDGTVNTPTVVSSSGPSGYELVLNSASEAVYINCFDHIADAGDKQVIGFRYKSGQTDASGSYEILNGFETGKCIILKEKRASSTTYTIDLIDVSSGFPVVGTGTTTLNNGTEYFIELYWEHTNSGVAELFIDGTQEYSVSAKDFNAGGTFGSYRLIANSATSDARIQSVYIASGATASTELYSQTGVAPYFEVFYRQTANATGTPDAGLRANAATALTTGVGTDLADTPGNDANLVTMDGSADYATFDMPAFGAEIDGDSNIVGVGGIWRAEYSGGGSAAHFIGLGDSGDGNAAASQPVTLTTVPTEYYLYRTTDLPTKAQQIRQGMANEGARNIDWYEMWAMVAHVPAPSTGPQNLVGVIASDPWTASPVGTLVGGPANLSGSIASDPWVAVDGALLAETNLVGVIASDPWIPSPVGTLAPGNANLSGAVANDPWVAAPVGLLAADQNLSGAVAADPWTASPVGILAPGNANLSGSVAADLWLPSSGGFLLAEANLSGSVAADLWLATDGTLAPGNSNLSGVVAADLWVATTGVLATAAGAQNLLGVVANDPWIASPVGALFAETNLFGAVAADPWLPASVGALFSDTNLIGVIANDPWIATDGLIIDDRVLAGVVAADPWIATLGTLAPGNVSIIGDVAADLWLPSPAGSLFAETNLIGNIAADPWIATIGFIQEDRFLAGLVAADPWVATIGAASGDGTPQILAGAVAADLWGPTAVGLLVPGNANLTGDPAADPWTASPTGLLLPGNVNVSGVVAADPWVAAAEGSLLAETNLFGQVAADPWQPAPAGEALPGNANLAGAVASDPWLPTSGALFAEATLLGLVAIDQWQAAVGGILGEANLQGVVAADLWAATPAGSLVAGNANLAGVPAIDLWAATVGVAFDASQTQFLIGEKNKDAWTATKGFLGPFKTKEKRARYVTDARLDASELIKEFGIDICLIVPGIRSPDPTKPWRVLDVADRVLHPAVGVFLDYNQRELDGTVIQAGDKKCFISANDVAIQPKPFHNILDATTQWYIRHVEVLAPNTDDILYTLQLRRGPTDDAFDGEGERRDVNFN